MKIARIGLTLTTSPFPMDISLTGLEDVDIKRMLYVKAQAMDEEEFINDMALWHTSAGHLEEDELQDDSVDKCDRAVISTMDREKAAALLNHPQTIQAMLMVFGQLITTPGTLANQLIDAQPDKDSEPH